jgi:integrase
LADLDRILKASTTLSSTRRRDLRSAVARVSALLGEPPDRLRFDLADIGRRLAAISPAAANLSPKRLSNIRSDFMAAVRISGLRPTLTKPKTALLPSWLELIAQLPARRARIGLSRLARFASAAGITPAAVDDAVIDAYIGEVRTSSLQRNPATLHRQTATIWNEVGIARPELGLQALTRASSRGAPQRIEWMALSQAFRDDVERYLAWCGGGDVFAADARPRVLAPRTLKLRRNQIHAAITALVASGTDRASIASLADLVTEDAFKSILRRRHNAVAGQENNFNRDLAESLVQIAREWVKVEPNHLAELKRMAGRVPMPASGLTGKNKRILRQFDDPAVLQRLHKLPARLWSEVARDPQANFRTLAKAQTALAIAMLSYMPLRLHNLAGLKFGTHLFLHDNVRATSTLEIPASEVKNKTELAFDIPQPLAKMLIDYRDRIARKIIGKPPERLFVKADGTPKSQAMVAVLIKTYLHKRAGIEFTPHLFRHLSAKIILDAEPGSFEIVRQMLGHKNLKTTVASYTGIDSRRAGRHHQHLIDTALAEQAQTRQRKNPIKTSHRQ